jgi:hypothetical protein
MNEQVGIGFFSFCWYNYNMTEDAVLFRQATKKEINFYFKKVYPLQDSVLELIDNPAFYLTVGQR